MSSKTYRASDKISISHKKGANTIVQFYQRLKDARIDKDMTQKETATAIGTTQQQIYKYENGKQTPTVERLKALCILYGVSADYIRGLPRNLKWPR